MKIYKVIIIVETLILASFIILLGPCKLKRSQISTDYAMENPLQLALLYESPLEKFEDLVEENPWWVRYKSDFRYSNGMPTQPILSQCATLGYTNRVRVLIEHGADVDEAIDWSRKYGSEDAVLLLQRLQKSVEEKGRMEKGEGVGP